MVVEERGPVVVEERGPVVVEESGPEVVEERGVEEPSPDASPPSADGGKKRGGSAGCIAGGASTRRRSSRGTCAARHRTSERGRWGQRSFRCSQRGIKPVSLVCGPSHWASNQ